MAARCPVGQAGAAGQARPWAAPQGPQFQTQAKLGCTLHRLLNSHPKGWALSWPGLASQDQQSRTHLHAWAAFNGTQQRQPWACGAGAWGDPRGPLGVAQWPLTR